MKDIFKLAIITAQPTKITKTLPHPQHAARHRMSHAFFQASLFDGFSFSVFRPAEFHLSFFRLADFCLDIFSSGLSSSRYFFSFMRSFVYNFSVGSFLSMHFSVIFLRLCIFSSAIFFVGTGISGPVHFFVHVFFRSYFIRPCIVPTISIFHSSFLLALVRAVFRFFSYFSHTSR